MLLIGGHALRFHINEKLNRESLDYDFICSYDEFEEWRKGKKFNYLMPENKAKKMVAKNQDGIFEFEIAWPDSTALELLYLIKEHDAVYNSVLPNCYNTRINVPNLDVLYTIKMSHRYLRNNPHFLKTMKDIKLMREFGAIIPDFLKDWYKKRQKETYDYSHPNLKQNKDGFFDKNQGVTYIYDHDSIHKAMAHLDMPAYEYYKDDNAEVSCSKEKFFNLPESVRLYGVLEEAYVLALERSQIPFKGRVSADKSFLMALEKVCTSITSGWFREFAWENYYKIVEMYDNKYVDKFWENVHSGVVKKL